MEETWLFYSESFLYDIYLIHFTPRCKDVLTRFVLKYTTKKNIVNAAVLSANYMNKTITIDVLTYNTIKMLSK
jgi:hypothetical protein